MSALLGVACLNPDRTVDHAELARRMADVIGYRGAFLEIVSSRGASMAVLRHDEGRACRAVGLSESGTLCGVDGILFDDGVRGESEVIAELHSRRGIGLADELDGEFAVACYDEGSGRLLLARDAFGTRPLCYAVRDGVCYFASEVKAVLEALPGRPRVNEPAIGDIVAFGYVPHPETMFADVFTVTPGTVVVPGHGTEHVFWRFAFEDEREGAGGAADGGSDEERGKRFMELLERSVEKRARRGGRVGAYLSGGLDSAAVCLLLTQVTGGGAPAISIGFEEEGFDELPDAEAAARHLGMEHISERIRAHEATPELFERLVVLFDAPFEDTSAIPTLAAGELASRRVDTVLTGDGPDQLLGGSRRHAVAMAQHASGRQTHGLLRSIGFAGLVRSLPLRAAGEGLPSKALRKLYRDSLTIGELGCEPRIAPLLVQRDLYSAGFRRAVRGRPAMRNVDPVMARAEGRHPLEQCLHFDVHFYLQDCLIPKVERACSRSGLECRMPFLDRELAAFVRRLPVRDRIDGASQKHILRRMVKPAFHPGAFERGKRGFAIPRDEWLCGPLREFVTDTLTSRSFLERGYFTPKAIRRLLDRFYRDGVRYYGASGGLLVALLTIELWHRIYIDRSLTMRPSPAPRVGPSRTSPC